MGVLQLSLAMKAGWMVATFGMYLGVGLEFRSVFRSQLVWNAIVAVLEITNVHLPSTLSYDRVLADFEACHKDIANIYAHVITTGVALVGVFGLINLMVRAHQKEAKTTKTAYLPLILMAVSWVLARYTVPDDDVAFLTVGVIFALAALSWHLKLSMTASLALLVGGMAGQEVAHMMAKETAYMWTYLAEQEPSMAAATFALHNVWLVPFELRSLITTVSASAMKAATV